MPDERDIVDIIDELIDESLALGPRDDYNVNRYEKCGHCGRDWHGIPLTAHVAHMYDWTGYREDYVAAEDESPVVCPGSDFIGPLPDPGYQFFSNVIEYGEPTIEQRWTGLFQQQRRTLQDWAGQFERYDSGDQPVLSGAPSRQWRDILSQIIDESARAIDREVLTTMLYGPREASVPGTTPPEQAQSAVERITTGDLARAVGMELPFGDGVQVLGRHYDYRGFSSEFVGHTSGGVLQIDSWGTPESRQRGPDAPHFVMDEARWELDEDDD